MPHVPTRVTDTGPATESIATARRQIDEVDDRIIDLLQRRREISHGIQRTRVDAGGTRLDAAREDVVIERYCRAFGASGDKLATVLLAICHG